MGVRISWLILVRNTDFARFALSRWSRHNRAVRRKAASAASAPPSPALRSWVSGFRGSYWSGIPISRGSRYRDRFGKIALFDGKRRPQHQLRHPQHSVHGCPDFVAHIGQEYRFRAVRAIEIVSAKSRCSTESGVRSISSAIPSTPFMGVRISWLILVRNTDFARFALSAGTRSEERRVGK